jgi:hypothetical protein
MPQVQRPSNYQPPAPSSAPATMAPKPPGGGPISLPPPPANAGAQFSAPAVEKKTSLYVGKIPEGQLPRLPPPASPPPASTALRRSRRSLPWRLCQRRATGARSHTCCVSPRAKPLTLMLTLMKCFLSNPPPLSLSLARALSGRHGRRAHQGYARGSIISSHLPLLCLPFSLAPHPPQQSHLEIWHPQSPPHI